MTAARSAVVDHSLAERRRYKREQIALAAHQFEPAQRLEARCKIADMSPGGAFVLSDAVPPRGTHVVVYIAGLGRFEGTIARTVPGGFGIEFRYSAHKREGIAELLTLYKHGNALMNTALRRHSRTPTRVNTSFTRANGDVVNCKMVDFSLSGVSLATEIRPAVGELVFISHVPGRVARHHDQGIGIEFLSRDKAVA
jgi:hypothetical protein